MKRKQRYTHKDFLILAKEVHGNRYNYSKACYNKMQEKIIITCKIHGDFKQQPCCHISQKQGCPRCGEESVAKKLFNSKNTFVTKSIKRHDNKYNYSRSIYKGCNQLIEIICPIHGPFWQEAQSHYNQSGCPKCYLESKPKSIEKFIEEALKIHGDRYDYSSVIYKRSDQKIVITCKTHGKFKQLPKSHLSGNGCRECTIGISKNEGYLLRLLTNYYPEFKIENNKRDIPKLYKKGIGNGNLEIDIVLSYLNKYLYIEWNGIYWHSLEPTKTHDRIKKDILGNSLVQIVDSEEYNEKYVMLIFNTTILNKIKEIYGFSRTCNEIYEKGS